MLMELTLLTASPAVLLTLITLVPVCPSRENVISIPSVRRNVRARRSRPASARGFFAHPLPAEAPSRALSEHKTKRSDALPSHIIRSAMIARMRLAVGSASMKTQLVATQSQGRRAQVNWR
jgi:hypothetical protein